MPPRTGPGAIEEPPVLSQVPPEPTEEFPPEEAVPSEEDVGLADELVYAVEDALEAGDAARVTELLAPLHVADLADLIEYLTSDARQQAVEILGPAMDPDTLAYDEELATEVRAPR